VRKTEQDFAAHLHLVDNVPELLKLLRDHFGIPRKLFLLGLDFSDRCLGFLGLNKVYDNQLSFFFVSRF